MLDRFGVLPEPGGLYAQNPAFVDELLIYLDASAAHEKKVRKDLERRGED